MAVIRMTNLYNSQLENSALDDISKHILKGKIHCILPISYKEKMSLLIIYFH